MLKIESIDYMKKEIRLYEKNSSTGKCKKDIKAYMKDKYDEVTHVRDSWINAYPKIMYYFLL